MKYIVGPYWCSYEAITERKATKCLDFSYFKLNDLEMIIKVTGKTVVKLFDEGYLYKCLYLIKPA